MGFSTAEALSPRLSGKNKSKTRKPETRRERRKKPRRNLRNSWVVTLIEHGYMPDRSLPILRHHPRNSSDFSSGFFLRSLRVSGFLVLLLLFPGPLSTTAPSTR